MKDTLKDVAELQAQQERRLTEVENRRIQLPDYSPALKEILQKLESGRQQTLDSEAVKILSSQVEQLNRKIPKNWQITHRHEFSPGSKGFIIGGAIILLAFFAALATAVTFWQGNRELSAHSVKYRLVRQYYPEVAAWTERQYIQSPDAAKKEVERMEAEQEALRLLEEATRKKEGELWQDRQKAGELRKKRQERQNR